MCSGERLRPALLASACIVALSMGCGAERRALPVALPDGATLQFDAAMIPVADAGTSRDLGRDSGPPDAGPTLPPATVNPDGVLTPYPYLHFTVEPSGFRIVSANFVFRNDDSGERLLEAFVEVRNVGTTNRCSFVSDFFLESADLNGRITADAYYERSEYGTISNVTTDCIPPGGTAVMDGVSRGITEAQLALAYWVRIDVGPYDSPYSTYVPANADVALTGTVIPVTGGFALSGAVTPRRPIYNFFYDVFPRDERGVLVAQLVAVPGTLGMLSAFTPHPYETEAAPRPFVAYLDFASWINE